jgi:dihydrofolate reductase
MKKYFNLIIIFLFLVTSSVCVAQTGNTIDVNLKYGTQSSSVLSLQQFLFSNNYLKATPNGRFGSQTLLAVKAFQSATGIPTTGYVGPQTRLKINNQVKNGVFSTTTTSQATEEPSSKDEKIIVMGGQALFTSKGDCYGRTNCLKPVNDVWSASTSNLAKWKKIKTDSTTSWERRYGFTTTNLNGIEWLIGGVGFGGKNDVWKSSGGQTWIQIIQSAPWTEKREHAAIGFNNKLWIFGGERGSSEIWNSSDGKVWTNITSSAPWGPRFSFTVNIFKGRLWLIGGQPALKPDGSGNPSNYIGDVWSSADGITWQKEVDKAPWANLRFHHSTFVLGNNIYVAGGMTSTVDNTTMVNYLSDVWSSEDGINWKLKTTNAPWGKRYSQETVVVGNTTYLFGGDEEGNLKNDIWSSTDGENWVKVIDNAPWEPRIEFQATLIQKSI